MLAFTSMNVSTYKHHFSFHFHVIVVTCMTLFCIDNHRFSDSLHMHACFPILWIFHSMFACMIVQSCLHSFFPCIDIFICFQLPIDESEQPWPKLYLAWTTLQIPKREAFPSSKKILKSIQTVSSRLAMKNIERQCLLAHKIVQLSPWACMTCELKLHITQSQHPNG